MEHTRPLHAPPEPTGPTEGDGISYRGIVWFVVILAATTLICQGLMVAFVTWENHRLGRRDPARSPVAAAAGELPPAPNLLTDEPGNLRTFRDHESAVLTEYGWMDRNAGTVRIPIERAKDLVIERGFGPIGGGRAASAGAPASGNAAAAVKKDQR
jgi:hypothetical protein